MSVTLNMVGGGGSGFSATDAMLRVQAPAGSTVTISKSGTTKSDNGHENADDNTVYDYYFIISQSQFDSVNPWTVTATHGVKTASDSIIINSHDFYNMELFYTLYLVENGVPAQAFSSSGGALGNQTYSDEYCYGLSTGGNYARIAYTSVAVDLTPYSMLYVDTYRIKSYSATGCPSIGISQNIPSIDSSSAVVSGYTTYTSTSTDSSTHVTYSVDVSSYTGYYYIFFATSGTRNYTGLFYFSDIYLDI